MINKDDFVKWPVNGGWVYGQVLKVYEDEGKSRASVALPFENGITEQPVNDIEKITQAAYDEYLGKQNKTGEVMAQNDKTNEIETLKASVADLNSQLEAKSNEVKTLSEQLETSKADLDKANTDLSMANDKLAKIEAKRLGENRLGELKTLSALEVLELDETEASVDKLATMSQAEFDSTVKLAKAFAKKTEEMEKKYAEKKDPEKDGTKADEDKPTEADDKSTASDNFDVNFNEPSDDILMAQAKNFGDSDKEAIQSAWAGAFGVKLGE